VRIVFRPSSASPSRLVFMRPPPMAVVPRLKLELPPKALPRLQEPLAQAGGCQKPSEAAPAAQKGEAFDLRFRGEGTPYHRAGQLEPKLQAGGRKPVPRPKADPPRLLASGQGNRLPGVLPSEEQFAVDAMEAALEGQ